jgi:hypothetical protein
VSQGADCSVLSIQWDWTGLLQIGAIEGRGLYPLSSNFTIHDSGAEPFFIMLHLLPQRSTVVAAWWCFHGWAERCMILGKPLFVPGWVKSV